MSYTIPTSVQTKAEAVLAVASAIADEDMGARYDGTVNTSLDVLADVLAAQDVDVPQTNAGAILALAQYAHGGGGGGTVDVNIWNTSEDKSLAQVIPEHVRLLVGYDMQGFPMPTPIYSDPIPFEQVTTAVEGTTIYGLRISGVQVGAGAVLEAPTGYSIDSQDMAYAPADAPFPPKVPVGGVTVPRPLDGLVVTGMFTVISES